MILPGHGDSARYVQMRQDNTRLRETLDRLTSEMSTGRKADISSAVGIDMTAFSHIRRQLRLNESFATGLGNAAMMASTRQNTLDRLTADLEGFGSDILSVIGNTPNTLKIRLADAPERFESAIMSLNTQINDQFLFSGDTPDQPALAAPEDILAPLRAIVAGAVDSNAAITAIDAWFQNGGDYDTVAALGSATGGGDVFAHEGQTIDAGVTVHETGIRRALSGLAMAAIASEGIFPGGTDPDVARFDLANAAAHRMLHSESEIIDIRARLGAAEGRIEEARVQTEATRTTLELEEGRLVNADPYATATEIEAVSLQLESLFLLTSRLSNLSLSNYLR